MTDPKTEDTPPGNTDADEAVTHGERSDTGQKTDALIETLTGTDSGSDTRSGSLQGGSASGSDDDPDQDTINTALAEHGRKDARGDTASD